MTDETETPDDEELREEYGEHPADPGPPPDADLTREPTGDLSDVDVPEGGES